MKQRASTDLPPQGYPPETSQTQKVTPPTPGMVPSHIGTCAVRAQVPGDGAVLHDVYDDRKHAAINKIASDDQPSL